MLKFALLFVALAAYGAYAVVDGLASSPSVEAASSTMGEVAAGAGAATDFLAAAAYRSVGVTVAPIPDTGCSESVIPPARVVEFVDALPEPQKTAVASLLVSSSTAWTVQVYTGPNGVGFCLPTKEKVIVMPSGVSSSVLNLLPQG